MGASDGCGCKRLALRRAAPPRRREAAMEVAEVWGRERMGDVGTGFCRARRREAG